MRECDTTPQIIVHYGQALSATGQCDCACDCACAEPSPDFQSHPALATNDLLSITTGAFALALAEGSHLLFNPFADRPAVVNSPGFDLWRAFAQPRPAGAAFSLFPTTPREAVQVALRQMLDLALLQTDPPMHAAYCIAAPRTLIAWLHVTNACNLRCSYCYLDKTGNAMSEGIGYQAIEAVFRSARAGGFRAVKLKYAGGEPTLNLPLVLQLHQQAQSLAERHNIELDGVILSNGIGWTPQMIESVKAHDLRVMLSLDGIGATHDAQRMFINGRGSFAIVSRTVKRLLARGIVPDISITVSDRNIDGLPDLMAWVLERDLPFSLNFYRENECAQGLRLSEQRVIAGMKAAYQVIEANLPRRSLLGSLLDRANLAGPHRHTCAAGRNYLVIDHHGRIAKCQMDIARPVTDIHAADPLAAIRASQSSFLNVDVDEKAGCRECAWRYGCAGGCPLQTFRATGHSDVQSPNCNIYKALFPDVLRLEGLRLLKYANA